ncbi:hypothetical protein G6F57_009360 [Rhizopus arrhizus]|jgi:hypothetical protein|nr:hypothetical protein G6F21_009284 [Rhizopus arrhizus]KAG1416206.1 hypothetical protein G6F58_006094 [Rhizopus delemar]KAG0785858.1 hypothetical protein G6F22_007815 [Rhizopus arrhizus]KAG0808695.1 hypothetical protein G6F20_009366 [Rhizopus arrhizus]KAG0825982.1 hypothetical protein G6F19_009527 [Rhizopus arrhizus]
MADKKNVPKISHAEAALGAGRAYEKQKGHNQMYDDYKDQQTANERKHGVTNSESRGHRIDRELEAADQEIIDRKNEAREQREQHRQAQREL